LGSLSLDNFPILGSVKKAYANWDAFLGNTKLNVLMYNPMDLVNKKKNIFFMIKKASD
jgi:hypothetical protein